MDADDRASIEYHLTEVLDILKRANVHHIDRDVVGDGVEYVRRLIADL